MLTTLSKQGGRRYGQMHSSGPTGLVSWMPSFGEITQVTSQPDTHDGFRREDDKRERQREKAFKERRKRLREAIRFAIDGPDASIVSEAQAAITPFLEAGKPLVAEAPQIDWEQFLADAQAVARVLEAARQQQEIEREDEEVLLISLL